MEDFSQRTIDEIKEKEDMDISFSNLFDVGSDSNLSLYLTFSQISKDIRYPKRKKANKKISRKVESETSNLSIFSNNNKKKKDIFLTPTYMFNFTRLFYL